MRRGAALPFAAAMLLLLPSMAMAEIPSPSPVPARLPPSVSAGLQQRHDILVSQHDTIDHEIDDQNSSCGNVAADDEATVSRCGSSQKRILGELADYKAMLDQYERALKNLPRQSFGERIGASADVRDAYWAGPDGVRHPFESGKPLFLNAHVVTGPTGHAQFLLLDETVFKLGPNSDMVLDEFVYDPDTSAGTIAATLIKGVFRFVTGKVGHQNPQKMTERLPSGSLGHRGTEYGIEIGDDGAVRLTDYKGEIYFVPTSGGPRVSLSPGQTVAIDPNGRAGSIQPLR